MNPIRSTYLQYGKQTIEEDDINAVIECLRENAYLTTGPRVTQFENAIADRSQTLHAVAVSNGTTALHCATYALDLKQGDEVIVTAISFVASANCILYQGATPVFCDVQEDTLNIDPNKIEALITNNTKAIICVDFCGQLCDYDKIRPIADKYGLKIIEDAAHAFGVVRNDGDLTTFSFHPVKNITTGEGGAIATDCLEYAKRMKQYRTHGINVDYKTRKLHYYDMVDIGNNYRITDIQCALGLSQIGKLDRLLKRRQEIAAMYDLELEPFAEDVKPLCVRNPCAYHIYVVKFAKKYNRDKVFTMFKDNNIGVNVHYKPIHLHTYYRENFNTSEGLCPVAEEVYRQIITLPIFPTMTNEDVMDVVRCIKLIINTY